jgi:hypothetical protein
LVCITRCRCRARHHQHIHRQRGGLAAADAQRRHAALEAALLQRAQQRDDDARAAGADRVAQRAGAAVHVDDLVRQLELGHRRHGDGGEGLVDLPQVDALGVQPAFQHLGDGTGRRGGEPLRRLRVHRVATMRAIGVQAARAGRGLAHQHQRRRAVGDAAGVGGGDGAVLLERGLQAGDLVELGLEGLLVELDDGLALARASVTGAISQSKLPSSLACLARWWRRWRTGPAPRG